MLPVYSGDNFTKLFQIDKKAAKGLELVNGVI